MRLKISFSHVGLNASYARKAYTTMRVTSSRVSSLASLSLCLSPSPPHPLCLPIAIPLPIIYLVHASTPHRYICRALFRLNGRKNFHTATCTVHPRIKVSVGCWEMVQNEWSSTRSRADLGTGAWWEKFAVEDKKGVQRWAMDSPGAPSPRTKRRWKKLFRRERMNKGGLLSERGGREETGSSEENRDNEERSVIVKRARVGLQVEWRGTGDWYYESTRSIVNRL